jgi:hypothetical protein
MAKQTNTQDVQNAPNEGTKPEANTQVTIKLPETQEEFEAALRAAKLEGAKETATQAAKQIQKLEEKVATKIGVNGFPKIVKEGKTFELQFCSQMVIKDDSNNVISISYEAQVNDEVAKKELNMTAKEVVELLFTKHQEAFTQIK